MKISSLVGHTAELYDLIVHEGRPADSIIDQFFRSHKYLGSNDRRFIAEHVYAMIRYRSRLEETVRRCSVSLHPLQRHAAEQQRTMLHCVAAMLLSGGEHPGRLCADYGETSDIGVLLAAILPALRETITQPFAGEPVAHAARIAWDHSFPEWMVEKFVSRLGVEGAEQFCIALNKNAPITLRVNTIKTDVEHCIEALAKEGVAVAQAEIASEQKSAPSSFAPPQRRAAAR